MSKYIDADKAIKNYAHYGISHYYDATDLEDILNECPAADVEEVVRCRDCGMWSDSFEVKDLGKLCMNFRIVTKPDFYCAWGSKE